MNGGFEHPDDVEQPENFDQVGFEEAVRLSMTNMIDDGLIYAKLDNEGDKLTIEQVDKFWFNSRLRHRLKFSMTEFGKSVAQAEDQREQYRAGKEPEEFPKHFR